MTSIKLTAALDAASRGFRVFPLKRDDKRPWQDGWQAAATTDEVQIRDWWTENPNYNVGVATGKGLVVVDVDVKNGKPGGDSLAMLDMMGLPESLRVRTPSGGTHIYFKINNMHSGREGNIEGFPGIDTRGDGNLVVYPGSNIGRNRYSIETDVAPAACPAWLFDIIETKTTLRVDRIEDSSVELDLPDNVTKAISWLKDFAPSAQEGDSGDRTTFSVAAELRAKGISETTALELMLDHWNEQKASPPWQPDELERKIKNAYAYGQGSTGGKTALGEFGALDIDVGEHYSIRDRRADNTNQPGSKSQSAGKLHFLTYEEMKAMPEPEWLVEGIVQKRSGALMFGKSNTFKSFLAIDIGLSVATGRDWHGFSVSKGRVLFVATEGANGVGRLRVPGWYEHYGIAEADRANALLFPKEICIDVKEDVDALIASVREGGECSLIVLDIFGGTMAGTEVEDTTARAWVRSVQRIIRETGAAVLTVAHTGWQDETRARMHTHFWGSFDSRMRVEGDKEKLTTCLTVERHKDADSSGSWGFQLEAAHGTLVPVRDDSVKPDKSASWPASLQTAMVALDDAVQAHGVLKLGDDWPACRVVELTKWREFCELKSLSNSEDAGSKRKAFNRAREGLQKKDAIDVFDGFVWSKFDAK